MSRRFLVVWSCAFLTSLLGGGTILADEVESGPAVNEKLSPLEVRLVQNGQAADVKDVLPDHAEHPTVYVFISAEQFDRPAAGYLRGIDGEIQKLQRKDPLAGFVIVWLAADPDAGIERVARIQQALRFLAAHWSVFPGGVNGPEGWAINDRAAVTTVIAVGREVKGRMGYTVVNDTNVKDVTEVLAKFTAE